jgi:hypothetical protein
MSKQDKRLKIKVKAKKPEPFFYGLLTRFLFFLFASGYASAPSVTVRLHRNNLLLSRIQDNF